MGVVELVFQAAGVGAAVERSNTFDYLLFGHVELPLLVWNLHQDVEVIGHDAVGENPAAGEVLLHTHIHAELLTFFVAEDKAAIHDARDAVVDRRPIRVVFPCCKPSRAPHVFNRTLYGQEDKIYLL